MYTYRVSPLRGKANTSSLAGGCPVSLLPDDHHVGAIYQRFDPRLDTDGQQIKQIICATH